MASELLYEVTGAVGVITFNRPSAHNALTFEMYDRLGEICASAGAEGTLRALIITGAGGRAFAAGTDISLFRDFRSAADGLGYEDRMEKVFNKLERCPVLESFTVYVDDRSAPAAAVVWRPKRGAHWRMAFWAIDFVGSGTTRAMSSSMMLPKPWQSGHAPNGLLKENSRGCGNS